MQETIKSIEVQKLISSIKAGLKDIEEGKTKPIETLWDELDELLGKYLKSKRKNR